MCTQLGALADGAQIVSAIGVVVATVAAFWAAKATERAADAQLLKSFLDEYATPEWNSAVIRLDEYSRSYDPHDGVIPMTQRFESKTVAGTVVARESELDDARRKVHRFYKHAWQLHETGFMSDKAFSALVDTNAYELFHDVAAPLSYNMERAFDIDKRWSWYQRLKKDHPPRGSRHIGERTISALRNANN